MCCLSGLGVRFVLLALLSSVFWSLLLFMLFRLSRLAFLLLCFYSIGWVRIGYCQSRVVRWAVLGFLLACFSVLSVGLPICRGFSPPFFGVFFFLFFVSFWWCCGCFALLAAFGRFCGLLAFSLFGFFGVVPLALAFGFNLLLPCCFLLCLRAFFPFDFWLWPLLCSCLCLMWSVVVLGFCFSVLLQFVNSSSLFWSSYFLPVGFCCFLLPIRFSLLLALRVCFARLSLFPCINFYSRCGVFPLDSRWSTFEILLGPFLSFGSVDAVTSLLIWVCGCSTALCGVCVFCYLPCLGPVLLLSHRCREVCRPTGLLSSFVCASAFSVCLSLLFPRSFLLFSLLLLRILVGFTSLAWLRVCSASVAFFSSLLWSSLFFWSGFVCTWFGFDLADLSVISFASCVLFILFGEEGGVSSALDYIVSWCAGFLPLRLLCSCPCQSFLWVCLWFLSSTAVALVLALSFCHARFSRCRLVSVRL